MVFVDFVWEKLLEFSFCYGSCALNGLVFQMMQVCFILYHRCRKTYTEGCTDCCLQVKEQALDAMHKALKFAS